MGRDDAEEDRLRRLHVPMLQVAFFICHFAACIFYFIARQYGFSDTTWIGANAAEVLDGKSTFLRCECPAHLVTGLSSLVFRAATARSGMQYLLPEASGHWQQRG